MGFYKQISKYYDYIFPVGDSQVRFIKEAAGEPAGRVVDVACGSGGYSVELARSGYRMTAVDLDGEMVRLAQEKAQKEHLDIQVLKCDMRELASTICSAEEGEKREAEQSGAQCDFRCVFCIGNSIVHLGSLEEIKAALKQMHILLEKGGSLVLQIINYDRIMKFGINELPAIKNDSVGLEFVRKYEYIKGKGIINFNTVLSINNNGKAGKYVNTVELFPVKSDDLFRVLTEAGFESIQFFGDFNKAPYSENSYMLVVKAAK